MTSTESGWVAPGLRAAVVSCIALVSCAVLPASESPSAGRDGPPRVVLSPGGVSARDQARAEELVETARAALAARRFDDALAAASRVVEDHAAAPASGEALGLVARAAEGSGLFDEARAAAARLARLLPPGDPRTPALILIEARALAALERPAEAVSRVLEMPVPLAGDPAEALDLVRAAVRGLDRAELGRILQGSALGQPLAAPVMTAYGRTLLLAGDGEEAARLARAAIELGANGDDRADAEALLEGRIPRRAGPIRFGAMLPLSGSPALRQFAEEVRDGIEVAVVAAGLEGAVELEMFDHGGDPATAGVLVRSIESQGVLGLVGPLREASAAAAVTARRGGLPVVSPTAYLLPDGAEGAYSLASMDPGAPQALAAWASQAGVRQAVVIHPSAGPSAGEAAVFTREFEGLGGSVLRTLTYEPGATFFQEQIQIVADLRPEVLVLPVPPEDVQALASQVIFFGLDSLGIQVLGTAGWADEAVLREVSGRYLDGVVSAAPSLVGSEADGYRRFVDAYERHFQRSLAEPGAALLGYDAASLVLLALRSGAATPAELRRALEDVRGFEGATGVISIEEGRVVREHQAVCLQFGARHPLPQGLRPVPVYRPYPPDPETGLVPEGPGRQVGFSCPTAPTDTLGGG